MQLFSKLSNKNQYLIKDEIARDLAHLMNHAIRSGTLRVGNEDISNSVLNFGLPTLPILGVGHVDRERLRSHLLRVIKTYEPRLSHEGLKIDTDVQTNNIKTETRAVKLIVNGYLTTNFASFSTSLIFDYQNAYFSVERYGSGGRVYA